MACGQDRACVLRKRVAAWYRERRLAGGSARALVQAPPARENDGHGIVGQGVFRRAIAPKWIAARACIVFAGLAIEAAGPQPSSDTRSRREKALNPRAVWIAFWTLSVAGRLSTGQTVSLCPRALWWHDAPARPVMARRISAPCDGTTNDTHRCRHAGSSQAKLRIGSAPLSGKNGYGAPIPRRGRAPSLRDARYPSGVPALPECAMTRYCPVRDSGQ